MHTSCIPYFTYILLYCNFQEMFFNYFFIQLVYQIAFLPLCILYLIFYSWILTIYQQFWCIPTVYHSLKKRVCLSWPWKSCWLKNSYCQFMYLSYTIDVVIHLIFCTKVLFFMIKHFLSFIMTDLCIIHTTHQIYSL